MGKRSAAVRKAWLSRKRGGGISAERLKLRSRMALAHSHAELLHQMGLGVYSASYGRKAAVQRRTHSGNAALRSWPPALRPKKF